MTDNPNIKTISRVGIKLPKSSTRVHITPLTPEERIEALQKDLNYWVARAIKFKKGQKGAKTKLTNLRKRVAKFIEVCPRVRGKASARLQRVKNLLKDKGY